MEDRKDEDLEHLIGIADEALYACKRAGRAVTGYHVAGLLVAVSNRLSVMLREGDMAARLGGDEFVILQCGLAEWDEAELFAHRLAATIAKPFDIEWRYP